MSSDARIYKEINSRPSKENSSFCALPKCVWGNKPEEQDTDPVLYGRGSYHSPLRLIDFGLLSQSHASPEQPIGQDTDSGL